MQISYDRAKGCVVNVFIFDISLPVGFSSWVPLYFFSLWLCSDLLKQLFAHILTDHITAEFSELFCERLKDEKKFEEQLVGVRHLGILLGYRYGNGN